MNTDFAIFSIAALGAAVAALIISLMTYARLRGSERERRDLRTLQIIREMQARSRHLLESFRERPEDGQLKDAYEDAAEDLGRAYEGICRQYYEDGTDQEWFVGMYGRDILSWVERGPLRDEFCRRRPRFGYTGRVYRELRRLYRDS